MLQWLESLQPCWQAEGLSLFRLFRASGTSKPVLSCAEQAFPALSFLYSSRYHCWQCDFAPQVNQTCARDQGAHAGSDCRFEPPCCTCRSCSGETSLGDVRKAICSPKGLHARGLERSPPLSCPCNRKSKAPDLPGLIVLFGPYTEAIKHRPEASTSASCQATLAQWGAGA